MLCIIYQYTDSPSCDIVERKGGKKREGGKKGNGSDAGIIKRLPMIGRGGGFFVIAKI